MFCSTALSLVYTFLDSVVTFRGRRKGILVFWWSQIDVSWQAQGIGVILLRRGDFVASAGLWSWGCSDCSDFVAGAVRRQLWHLDFVLGVALATKCSGRAAQCEV